MDGKRKADDEPVPLVNFQSKNAWTNHYSNRSNKRSRGDQGGESFASKTTTPKMIFHNLAEEIEALADTAINVHRFSDNEDIKRWCLEKVSDLVEKSRNRSTDRYPPNPRP